MFSRLRSRLTYANVTATLALFLAVTGGTAFAVTAIDDNSVRTNHIVNDEVRSGDVRDDTLTNGGLASPDIRPNALTGSDVNESTLGSVPNANRLNGKSSTEIGINGLTQVDNRSSLEASESPKAVTATCPGGTVLLGSGFDIDGGKSGTDPNVTATVGLDDLQQNTTAVSATAHELQATDANWRLNVRATCAKAP
jgi:hypothetical protein